MANETNNQRRRFGHYDRIDIPEKEYQWCRFCEQSEKENGHDIEVKRQQFEEMFGDRSLDDGRNIAPDICGKCQQKLCPCGSMKYREELYDARGIFCGFVCDECEQKRRSMYRPEIFHDPDYDCIEEVEPDEGYPPEPPIDRDWF